MVKKSNKCNQPARAIIAIAWYRPEQWQRLLAISADAPQLEKTHGQWLAGAEKAEKDLGNRNIFPHRVLVDVDELKAWCTTNNLPVNGDSRSRYATWLLAEQQQRQGG